MLSQDTSLSDTRRIYFDYQIRLPNEVEVHGERIGYFAIADRCSASCSEGVIVSVEGSPHATAL